MCAMKSINFGKKSELVIDVYVDISDPDYLRVLNDEEELKLPNPLPETIIKITSKWLRNNWLLQQVVEANSYSDRAIQGRVQRVFDSNASISAQVRVLLREWNMSDFDDRFKLEFEQSKDNPKLNILNDRTMDRLGELSPPDVLTRMLNKVILAEAIPKNLQSKKEEPKA